MGVRIIRLLKIVLSNIWKVYNKDVNNSIGSLKKVN